MAEPLNATFFAFRSREGGGALLRASIAFALLFVLIWGLYLFLNRAAIAGGIAWFLELIDLAASAKGDIRPEELPELPAGALGLLGGALLANIAYYVALAAYEATCLRWLIHGKSAGALGLSFGADTWRVWGVYWVWLGLNIAAAVATALIVGVLSLLAGDIWSDAADEWAQFAIQLGLIYFMVRLAPAAATSVGRGAFSFFEAWTVTRDRFWALLGSFVILGLILLLCYVAVAAGAGMLMWPSIGPNIMALIKDPENAGAVIALFTDLLSRQNLWIVVGAYAALAPAFMFMLLTYYGICARAVQAGLDEGKIERESAS